MQDNEEKPDPYALEGVKRRSQKPYPWGTLFFAFMSLLLGLVILSPIPRKIQKELGMIKPVPEPKVVIPEPKVIVEEKVVERLVQVRPDYYQVKRGTDIAKTSKGFDLKTRVVEKEGGLASEERERDGSYQTLFEVAVQRPVAARDYQEVVAMNPKLPEILPGLGQLFTTAQVSPFFAQLYENKAARLKEKISRMDRLLTKHNYYDCQTMLELEHPDSQRKVFLMQGDMDVVSDGSDGDRLPTMPDEIVNSPYYQPFTSYGWPKVGKVQNPMIAGWRRNLAKARSEGNSKEVDRLTSGIEDMRKRSFLIADYDPFIVIPVDVLQDRVSPFGPNIGDYAVVIYEDTIYPAIVGDGGPPFKVGEASLRMAKQINELASSYHRPVSGVDVTYLVFPRSSGKWKEPNYHEWREECLKLVEEIGGLGEGYELFRWENTLPSSRQ